LPNISIQVSESFKQRLDELVYKRRSTLSAQFRIALTRHLEEFEKQQRQEKPEAEQNLNVPVVTVAPEARLNTPEKRLILCKQAWDKFKRENPTRNYPTAQELVNLVLEMGSGPDMHPAMATMIVRESMPILEEGNGHG
jgi:hypothetical protein